jgi:AcrR family transcriptional regulator
VARGDGRLTQQRSRSRVKEFLSMTETQSANESDLAARMVQATIQLLTDDGPEALQVRRVAEAVGVSSMVVYSRFGGMPQLVEAVIEEGFRQLGERFARFAPMDDPVADVYRIALAYHESARDNPHLFDLMFGLSTPGGYRQIARPTRLAQGERGTAFDVAYRPLVDPLRRAIRAKRIRRANLDRVAAECWSAIHGFTMLDLGGHFSHFADPFTDVFAPTATHVLIGLGDSPRRAAKSMAAAFASPRG